MIYKDEINELKTTKGLLDFGEIDQGILGAEYNPSENPTGISGRIRVNLPDYVSGDNIQGSALIEQLGSSTDLDVAVLEVPYFSENSGPTWEKGWNSRDMIVQVEDMNISEVEYLLTERGNTSNDPASFSITEEIDGSGVLEFRQANEYAVDQIDYEPSQTTINAWTNEYGEGIFDLSPTDRGIWAALSDGNEIRGSDVNFAEAGYEDSDVLNQKYEEIYEQATKI